MAKYKDYNIYKYMNSIVEVVKNMVLDGIINQYKVCKRYSLSDEVSEYLRYIDSEPFYVSPSFTDVKTKNSLSTLNPKFLLFSAPGATGKSTLAEYISNKFNGIYWDLAKLTIGVNTFMGTILNAVGAPNYSNFINDLNNGDTLLVIDAFDEAEIISGRKMLDNFLVDINKSLTDHKMPSVILLARTETAQYIASFCAENSISLTHYEIGFFDENAAKEFITKSCIKDKEKPSKPLLECIDSYYGKVKQNITPNESKSFLGYAPVLQAIAKHIYSPSDGENTNNNQPNYYKLTQDLSTQQDCVSIIIKIMDDLLIREKDKVVSAFIKKCEETHPEFTSWDKVYSSQEQLVRLIYYILGQDKSYDNYELDYLPPQLVDDYQTIVDSFLPQHPFIRQFAKNGNSQRLLDFTGPAFRDYTLAKLILDLEQESLVDMYFEESQSQSFFPSQIFFDCYMKISNNIVQRNHISYVYDSFKSKATAYECPYLCCFETNSSETEEKECRVTFGMNNMKQNDNKREDVFAVIPIGITPLKFNHIKNVSIDTPSMSVELIGVDSKIQIYNSSVICKNIILKANNISIESYEPEGCLLVAKEGFIGNVLAIDIIKDFNLKICSTNINSYYKFIPYSYDFENSPDDDIMKFVYVLRCILLEFRTHGKDMLAKTADRIDYVIVGNNPFKKRVLAYLKEEKILNHVEHLYKVDEAKMQSKGINFNSLYRLDSSQMQEAFEDFNRLSN